MADGAGSLLDPTSVSPSPGFTPKPADGDNGLQPPTNEFRVRGFNSRAASFIAAFEQSGGDEHAIQKTYESKKSHYAPHVPDGAYARGGRSNASGVTLGFGYDLGQHSSQHFKDSWGDVLTKEQMDALEPYTGSHSVTVKKKGKIVRVAPRPTKAALAVLQSDVHVKYADAVKVFQDKTLPEYREQTYKYFPGLKEADPWTQAAILDMTYQRGPGVKGKPVLEIKKALLRKDTKAVAAALRKMTVFHARRVAEAKLIEEHLGQPPE